MEEPQKLTPKEDQNYFQKLVSFLSKILPASKSEKDTKESYMKVYEKQSTEKTVRGTQLMLQYVASKGIKTSPEIMNTLTYSKEKIEAGKKLKAKEEAKFWTAYSELSAQIQPVTVKSLKCIREEFGVYSGIFKKKKISYAERIQGFYRRTGIGVLILVLFTQVFWLWQNYLLKEANENSKKLKIAYSTLHTLKNYGTKDTEKEYQVTVEKMELEKKLSIQKKNLISYTSPISVICYPFQLLGLNWCGIKEEPSDQNKERKADNLDNPESSAEYKELFDEEYIKNVQELTFSVEILTLYLLPLAYGLLGSCTYILRVIALEIERQIYVREHDIQYALRTLLGTFAGFVIGWFISSDAEISTGFSPTKLSPFAIAFLAGYSVELLFTVLDKIVAVYSGTEKKKVEEVVEPKE